MKKPKPRTRKQRSTSFRFTPETLRQLQLCAIALKLSRAKLIERLIQSTFSNLPTTTAHE